MTEHEFTPAVLLSPEEAAARLGVGRTTLYGLLKSGELRSVRIGRLRRVPLGALRSYMAHLLVERLDQPSPTDTHPHS